MKTLVIIPAYNESCNIEMVINDVRKNFHDGDYVVINDCSTDNTVEILKSLKANYINLPINLGIGGGVQAGYKYAFENGYDIAVQFDGDGQHDASYIEKLIQPIVDDTADFTIGSRFIENDGFQSTTARRTGIKLLSREIDYLCGIKVKDVTSGFRAVNRKAMEMFCSEYAQDYPEPEAVLLAGKSNLRISEIPVKMRERQGGKSSINPFKSVYYMIKVSLALLITKGIN